jgi:hypothetical protein
MLTILSLFCLASSAALAKEKIKISMGTSSAGSSPYIVGAAFSKIVNAQQDLVQVSSQATAGYNENIVLVSSGEVSIGQCFASTFIDAWNGNGLFDGKPQKRLRMMFTFLIVPYHVTVRQSANIETVSDLKGKKINIGVPAQSTREFNEIFLKDAGIGLKDFKIFEMSTGQAFRALQDGVIDASLNFLTAGSSRLVELTTNTNVKILNLPDDLIDRLQKDAVGTKPTILPAKLYKGTDNAVKTLAIQAVAFCRDDMSEEVAYQITKSFWGNMDELNKLKVFKNLSLKDSDPNGYDVPYHPGVLKFFKEIGLIN